MHLLGLHDLRKILRETFTMKHEHAVLEECLKVTT